MIYLLDTNIVSELRRPERANPGVMAWVSAHFEGDAGISVLTMFELEAGTVHAERHSPELGRALRKWFDNTILPSYGGLALPVSENVVRRAAQLDWRSTGDLADHLIAATALEHDLILVTRNEKHLRRPGVRLLNPFT